VSAAKGSERQMQYSPSCRIDPRGSGRIPFLTALFTAECAKLFTAETAEYAEFLIVFLFSAVRSIPAEAGVGKYSPLMS